MATVGCQIRDGTLTWSKGSFDGSLNERLIINYSQVSVFQASRQVNGVQRATPR